MKSYGDITGPEATEAMRKQIAEVEANVPPEELVGRKHWIVFYADRQSDIYVYRTKNGMDEIVLKSDKEVEAVYESRDENKT